MIEALAIIGGATTATAIAVIAYLAYKLANTAPTLIAAGKDVVAADRRAMESDRRAETYRQERDDAVKLAAERTEEAAAAIVRLKLAEKQRNEAAEEATKRVVEAIRTKSGAGAVRIVDELLALPLLPASGKANPTGSGGDGA